MVNPRKVYKLLQSLDEALDYLKKIASISWEDYSKDSLAQGAAKYYLQTSIEACIDIGNHIISSESFRSPKDYREVFVILLENEIISEEVADIMSQMAGLRNRLVHLYWEIDESLIHLYLQSNLTDLNRYSQLIIKFLEKHKDKDQ